MRAGRNVLWTYEDTMEQFYDGDGRAVKSIETNARIEPSSPTTISDPRYQLWSSVLGGAITEITHTGAKLKTKIFAGGAVIAEQIANPTYNLEKVEWFHADPISGSTTRTNKAGADQERKEYEALGQEVQTQEPPEEPVAVSPNYNTADEPEWLCDKHTRDKTDFFELPVHCQINALDRMENLKELFPSESNPVKIIFHDTSLPKSTRPHSDSVPDKMLSYAATSTDKKKKKKDENEACTYDEDGNPTCVIQAEHRIDSTVSGFVDVEYSNLTEEDKERHLNNLKDVVSKSDCKLFTTTVLDILKKTGRAGYETTDINELAKSIFNNEKNLLRYANWMELWSWGEPIYVRDAETQVNEVNTKMTFDSNIYGKKLLIYRGTSTLYQWGRVFDFSDRPVRGVQIFIHELFHAYGKNNSFGHRSIAEAVHDAIMKIEGRVTRRSLPDIKDFLDPSTGKLGKNGTAIYDTANTSYFQNYISDYCK